MDRLLAARRAADLQRRLDAADGADPAAVPADSDADVALVARLTALRAELEDRTAPRAEFRAQLRTRLEAVATVQPHAPAAAPAPARRASRGAAVVAGALAVLVGTSGVAVASSQSLPGDPFYGLKRGAEQLQVALASGPLEEGEAQLQLATERLGEVDALLRDRGDDLSRLVVTTLSDMDDATREGTGLLTDAFFGLDAGAPLELLDVWSAEQSTRLTALLPELPDAARDRAQLSLDLVGAVRDEAAQLLSGTCTPACVRAGSPALPGEACDCPDDVAGVPAPVAPTSPGEPGSPGSPAEPVVPGDPQPGLPGSEPAQPVTPAPPGQVPAPGAPTPAPAVPTAPPVLPLPVPLPVPTELPLPTLPGSGLPTSVPLPTLPVLPDLPLIGDLFGPS